MDDGVISPGFQGRRPAPGERARIPPGQYLEQGFPVLTAGPSPRPVPPGDWDFRLQGPDGAVLRRWTWAEIQALPHEDVLCDIHCVTQWSKLDTRWRGVSLDLLLQDAPAADFVLACCDGGYTTDLPRAELLGGRAWIADTFAGAPLARAHGGPVRLLVPHLYFWKSAKWVRGLRLCAQNTPGFWEQRGYHHLGDPWREQRFWND